MISVQQCTVLDVYELETEWELGNGRQYLQIILWENLIGGKRKRNTDASRRHKVSFPFFPLKS
jgi:hypothetical protein